MRAVVALEALSHTRLHAEERGALRRPVARAAGSILVPGEHDERYAALLVLDRGLVDRGALSLGLQERHAALDAWHHQILDADVGEGAAHHHLVVAAPCAIGVEVLRRDAQGDEVLSGRRAGLDRSGRTDVIG